VVDTLRTRRLVLRRFRMEDLEDLLAIQSLPEVARYLYWEPRDREEVREALAEKVAGEPECLQLAVELIAARRVIGEVTLRRLSREHRQGEIGFVFHPAYQGQGYAREAAEAMLRIGFLDWGLHRIIGRCDARNHRSARLMERLGMRLEAHFQENEIFKGEWGDELVYAILDREFVGPSSAR
jgi:RimJ/RimL family protein N-acetyltransferase